MRDRSFLIVASLLAVLMLGAGTLYVYDTSRDDKITDGVRVADVDVGGMKRDEARALLASELRRRLDQPIVLRIDHKRFRLIPRLVGATFDLDATVDEAIARGREGNILTRTIRSLRGEPVNADVPARVSYSQLRLTRFLTHVEHRVNRKPRDASINFIGDGLEKAAGRDGLLVYYGALRRQVVAAMTGLLPDQTIPIRVRRTHPRLTKADLAREYPTLIVVNRSEFKLRFYRRLRLVKSYAIAVGQVGLETPAGLYHIQNKAVDPAWNVPNSAWAGDLAGTVVPGGSSANPLKARWLGIFNGAGIHGTDNLASLGSAASHGCIRMAVPDVIQLYDRVDVGTPVYIA